jgi:farnesyl diphosphate synthase
MNKDISDFPARLASAAAETEVLLKQLLGDVPLDGEILRPSRLVVAMRHAALDGGKRLRPFLLVETAAIFGAARTSALMAGAALEFVHCYSLVHDGLPPWTTMICAADGSFTRPSMKRQQFSWAMHFLRSPLMSWHDLQCAYDPAVRVALISELARASGLGGWPVNVLDLAAEGRRGKRSGRK